MQKTNFLVVLLALLFSTSSVRADGGMMDSGFGNGFMGFGGMGIFGGIWMLVFWGLLIAGIIFLIKLIQENKSGETKEDALDILKKRLAKGEINKKEFQELKRELKN